MFICYTANSTAVCIYKLFVVTSAVKYVYLTSTVRLTVIFVDKLYDTT